MTLRRAGPNARNGVNLSQAFSQEATWGSPQIVEGLLYAALGVRAVVS